MPAVRPDAPPELLPVERFCNSVSWLLGRERLADPESAGSWLRGHGLDAGDVDEAGLRRLHELREAIRDHLERRDPVASSAVLNAHATRVLAVPGWDAAGDPVLPARAGSEVHGVDILTAQLLAVLFRAGMRGDLARLKTCRATDCRWVFYDRSPARGAVWCSMEVCGSRHKMRTYRARRAPRSAQ